MITAIFSVGNHHPDEHFQILEFAGYKLGLANDVDLAWEFHFRMRPTIQPAMVVVVYRFFALFGLTDTFFIAMVMRLLSAALSFYSIWLVVNLYMDRFKTKRMQTWFVALSFLIWIALYNNVRFSSENWSANLFMIGFVLLMKRPNPKLGKYILAGVLFGLSFVIRYQMAFMVLGFGVWLWLQRKDPFGKLLVMTAAFLSMFGLGIVIDRWFYGEWVITTWNYLEKNIIEGRASGFGESPWYYYITQTIMDAVPPFSLMYVVPFLWLMYKRPKSVITWTIIPFLAIHFLISHKETRFMFSLLGFMPVVIMFFLEWVFERYGDDLLERNKWALWYKKLFWFVNSVLVVVVMFRPANNESWQLFATYHHIKGPAIIYYGATSPLGDELEWKFFNKSGIELVPYELVDTILPEPNRQVFLGTYDLEMVKKYKDKGSFIYRSYPEFLRNFNINGWIERTAWYYIIELKPNE